MAPKKRKAAEASDSDIDPAKMKVADLKAELEKRSLDSSGKKADLVKRLQDALGGDSTDSAAPPAKKKKAAAKKGAKKEEEAEEEKPTTMSQAIATLKAGKKKPRQAKVDKYCPLSSSCSVLDDWDCMLNQTNIGFNNNKYYVIQLLHRPGSVPAYYVWNRWGRVGEPGQNKLHGAFRSLEPAEKEFKKKFQDKTKNKWENRENFTPHPGKYTLLDMGDEDDDDDQAGRLAAGSDSTDGPPKVVKTCTLPSSTQSLVKLLFDEDMFRDAMKGLEIDTKKLPLGKLSKPQIAKGFEVLEEIKTTLDAHGSSKRLMELSSKFYTLIPHDFGRQRPPMINSHETLQRKMDMLMVLADIELAQSMQTDKKEAVAAGEVPHPLDEKYGLLKANLTPLDSSASVRSVLEKYLSETCGGRSLKILDIFEVDRHGEGDRFSAHESISNRRLLWHGTNVAVVAAILKTGLRIMPHSGGRVGKGIYFASENSKSAGYVRCAGSGVGIMFLAEVALGKEHHIDRDDWTLKAPPSGHECIIAKGRTEPDPTKDTKIKIEGKDVTVPQGPPLNQSKWSSSSFWQSEYLVYKESQARLRYLLKIKFH